MTPQFKFIDGLLTTKFCFSAILTSLCVYFGRRIYFYLQGRSIICKLQRKHLQLSTDRRALKIKCEPDLAYLLSLEPNELRQLIISGKVTPLQILSVFQSAALELLPQNCIAEVIKEASDTAINLPPVNESSLSPIYGIPVSIKEHLEIAGYDSPCGLVKNTEMTSVEDSLLVKVLKSSGAIPFVTTSMPPLGLSINSSNVIYGEQCNPFDKTRLAGGSSGGEAILICGKGSPLGFGSDIAGSLRIPASFCGISSLKPTFHRLSILGMKSEYKLSTLNLNVCIGPMAKKVETLADAMRTLLVKEMFDADSSVVPLPFDDNAYLGKSKKKLTIGYYTRFYGEFQVLPSPSIERAVLEAKSILENMGHTLVEFQPPDMDSALIFAFKALFADGGFQIKNALVNEPMPSNLRILKFTLNIPSCFISIIAFLSKIFYSKILGTVFKSMLGCKSVEDVLQLLTSINKYEKNFAACMLNSGGIDVIICPSTAYPAPLKSTSEIILSTAILYTILYNIIDYPAGVVPVGHVTVNDVVEAEDAFTLLRSSIDPVNLVLLQMQKGSEGLPLSVQVVGKPFMEETVLRIMREIEVGAKFWPIL